jgi:hypothetical protein
MNDFNEVDSTQVWKWVKRGLWVLALILLVTIPYSCTKGANNKFVHYEEEIIAVKHYIENKHNSMYQDMKSSGAIRNMSQEQFRAIVELNMNSKIPTGSIQPGAFGGMAVTKQNMGENFQEMDKELMRKIQPYVKDIERAQTAKIKLVRDYKRTLRNIPDKWYASILGFPSAEINLKDEAEVISSGESKETMRTKTMDAINPTGDKSLDGKTSRENLQKK